MSDTVSQHKSEAPTSVSCAVITVSDTRTIDTDRGGALLVEMLTAAGHSLAARSIVPDEPAEMTRLIREQIALGVGAVLMTGGTGISARDQTFETVTSLFQKPLPGYGELFRMLSYEDIGAAAMLSRATGGVIGKTVLLTMPGSPAAVRLAMEKLVLPELAHLVREATKA
jgi:molybdenum cofactor biosynthesis protein B